MENNQPTESWNTPRQTPPNVPIFRVDPLLVLLLGIITCGLYLIYWNIKIADVVNAANNRTIVSGPVAIFAGCCYPVNIYFFYVLAKDGLPAVYELSNRPKKDDTALLLVLGFLLPMVAAMIVQGDVNKLYDQA